MTDRFPATHTDHDPLLIAAFAAGDLGPTDRQQAELLASTCADCALLEADLRAIAATTAALPVPARRRDFSLSAEDAARLRRRGWRGVLGVLASPRSAALKPLATGLTTLGLAGLLLAALPAIQLGGSVAAPTGSAAPAAAPPEGDEGSDGHNFFPAASTTPDRLGGYGGASPLVAEQDRDAAAEQDRAPLGQPQPEPAPPVGRVPSLLALLSGAFLVIGLALFGIRWTARRLSDA
jgi:hypothetical protein